MACFAYDNTGSVLENPDSKQMLALLQSMVSANKDQPDVSLNDEDGWSISYSSTGTLILGSPESSKGPWHMKNVPVEQAHQLWLLFAEARLDELRARPWLAGQN